MAQDEQKKPDSARGLVASESARVTRARERFLAGEYDTPDVMTELARRLLNSGDL